MTPSGSLDRWIEGSQTPKGHNHEIQHALGQRPGEFVVDLETIVTVRPCKHPTKEPTLAPVALPLKKPAHGTMPK